MCLRYSFDLGETADRIEKAIAFVLDEGYRTADIAQETAAPSAPPRWATPSSPPSTACPRDRDGIG